MMTRFALAVLWLLHWLPVPVLAVLARVLGGLGYVLARERRRVGLINLRLCFPELSLPARRRIILRHCQHLVQSLLEYGIVWWGSPARLRRLVTLKNLHHLTDQAEHNTIILYPHFVAFELCVLRLNLEQRMVSVYSNQKNPVLNAQLYRGRNRFDNAKIVSRQEGLRSIIKAMRDHTPFLYLPDQDFGPRDSVFVKFFAEDAATITGLSRISALAKAKVVPAMARRVGFRYELEFYPAWENFPTDDVVADTRRMNAFIEERVREDPSQYYWLHKRFKTRPPGEARFYLAASPPHPKSNKKPPVTSPGGFLLGLTAHSKRSSATLPEKTGNKPRKRQHQKQRERGDIKLPLLHMHRRHLAFQQIGQPAHGKVQHAQLQQTPADMLARHGPDARHLVEDERQICRQRRTQQHNRHTRFHESPASGLPARRPANPPSKNIKTVMPSGLARGRHDL